MADVGAAPIAELEVLAELVDAGKLGRDRRVPAAGVGAAPIAELEVLADLVDAGELGRDRRIGGRHRRRADRRARRDRGSGRRAADVGADRQLEVLADPVDAGELGRDRGSPPGRYGRQYGVFDALTPH